MAGAPLPGGEFHPDEFEAKLTEFHSAYPFLNYAHARRLFGGYGTDACNVLADARSLDDLGRHFGHDLYEREVDFLRENEFATSAQDILWRRTKLGLHLLADEVAALEAFVGLQGEPAFLEAAE